jgi:RHS repeat-associated protein
MADTDRRPWWFTAADKRAGLGGGPAGGGGEPAAADESSGPRAPGNAPHTAAGGSLPSISLPKGGGAIRGIDEKLSVNQATGTASLTVPVFASPARSGFSPSLALAYDSGGSNGPFGLGWSLSLPHITRKTSKGLPRYDSSAGGDVFILSGAEDLIPRLDDGGSPVAGPRTVGGVTFDVTSYRPRVESGFARVEHWRDTATDDVHWRTITRENVTSLYGQDASSRIADPADPLRIFTWLLDLSFDDRGNAVSYGYKAEDREGMPVAANVANRVVGANRYLKHVLYGNRTPYAGAPPAVADCCFQLVFDYGEHDRDVPTPDLGAATAPWSYRPDPFSSYRSCFEVRTSRLCRRVLMFHNFTRVGPPKWFAVRSTDLTYQSVGADASLPTYSLLGSVKQTGWVVNATGGYDTLALPAVDFAYEPLVIHEAQRTADQLSLENLPGGSRERWIDINGEGLKGRLSESERAWYYKRNVSAWDPSGGPPSARLEPLTVLAEKPSAEGLSLTDLNGSGNLCAVKLSPPDPGWFEYDADSGWAPYRPLDRTASIDWGSSELRLVDVTGDGLADVLVCEDDTFSWHAWIVDSGFAAAARAPKPHDEEHGPALVFADPTACVFLADMSGDGLTDLVRIRSGEVCYWPNLGYGRFGTKIAMDGSPLFDFVDQFDARRVRLADIDGSGTADVVYLSEQTTVWFNQSGGSWTAPHTLTQAPRFDRNVEVDVLDLLGIGTACLVWTSGLPGDTSRPLRYVDLTGGVKPYLLRTVTNNFGAQRTIGYATSTKFYLRDRAAGKPWLTRLPFPVHVVERVDTTDAISGTRYTTTYSYHHGYYDGVEREFRGFARVDTTDTDAVPAASGIGDFSWRPPVDGDGFELAPVLTRTWFHTGAFFGWGDIAAHLQLEYYALDPEAPQLSPTVFSSSAAQTPEELREAARALRGRMLRAEVYALDGTARSVHPYVTREHRYRVDQLQPATASDRGGFYPWGLESVACHYERDPSDPRIAHTLTLAIDPYGNVTRQATVAYRRRPTATGVLPQQGVTLVRYVESDFLQIDDVTGEPDTYRAALPFETREYELTGYSQASPGLYDIDAVVSQIEAATKIAYEVTPDGSLQLRLLGRRRTYYRRDDLTAALPARDVESLAIIDASYTLRYTAGLLQAVYGVKLDAGDLAAAALVDLDRDGDQWAPTARLLYSNPANQPDATYAAAHFYLPQGSIDPWGSTSTVAYDEFSLLPVSSTDAVGNVTLAANNYRLLRPWLVTDPNQNRMGARYDAIGMLTATAAMGKVMADGSDEGDHLDLGTDEPSPLNDDPTTKLSYDLTAYADWAAGPSPDPDHPQPASVRTRARVIHKDQQSAWLQTWTYTDGLGRVALAKQQAEPGLAPQWKPDGSLARDPVTGQLALAAVDSRWVGSGRVVYDNKGNPVKAYEPFFDSASDYVAETELVEWGVTAITTRDPLGRVIRVDNPDGTLRRLEFDAWHTTTYDENDSVLESVWYQQHSAEPGGSDGQDAAVKAMAAAGTPSTTDLDSLGRAFQSTVDNGNGVRYSTVVTLDIDGRELLVTDALHRPALKRVFDLTGAEIHSSSIDAGERWLLFDAAGQPVNAWDGRGFAVAMGFDAARRPTTLVVTDAVGTIRLAEKLVYGEGAVDAVKNNLRGVASQHYDEAGIASTDRRDFDGNVVSASRALLSAYDTEVDWNTATIGPERYTATTTYDALNRPTSATTPDGSVTTCKFNERGLIAAVEVAIRGAMAVPFVSAVGYNEKGHRLNIAYGNGAATIYAYERETFRLAKLVTSRPSGPNPLQDLSYAYDPVGNVTRISDAAQQMSFFNNQAVLPATDYTYDPIYRLILASGRESIGQTGAIPVGCDDSERMGLPLGGDLQAMRNYTQSYHYDAIGNITTLGHAAAAGGWQRTYAYPAMSNQLTSTTISGLTESYAYDAHGNITSMPHLSLMQWDWKDQLQATARQIVNNGTPETTYYDYDSAGQRVIKATYGQTATIVSRRVYLGGYELYQEYAAGNTASPTLERHTLHVSDAAQRIAIIETTTVDSSTPATGLKTPAPVIRYHAGNHLGSSVVELDADAGVISYEEYYPYGSTSFQTGPTGAEVSLKRYRYTGKERDGENAFYYQGARYYAPWLARWTAADPQRSAASHSLYAYVSGNPIRLVDPSGQDDEPGWLSRHIGPSSWFGQWVSHASYPGSSFIQDDKKLAQAQLVAGAIGVAAATVATGGAVGELTAGYLATSAGAAASTGAVGFQISVLSGASGAVAGGATFRYGVAALAGTLGAPVTVGDALRAAADPQAVATDALAGGALGGAAYGAARAGQAWGARAGIPLASPPSGASSPKAAPTPPPAGHEPATTSAPGTQLSLFGEQAPAPTPPPVTPGGGSPEIPHPIDIAEIKSMNWTVDRTLAYGGKYVYTSGLEGRGGVPNAVSGVQGAVRYSATGEVQVDLFQLGGFEPHLGTYKFQLDPADFASRTAGLKYGTSQFGNAIEGVVTRRLSVATGEAYVGKSASAGGADVLPVQLRWTWW